MSHPYWLDKHLTQWRAALAADHRPHAVIIQGEAGVGKAHLMAQIVADLLCRNANPEACGHCQNCLLHGQGHHPDVHRVEPEKNLIKVAAVRELNQFFTSTPHCSDHKVAVLMAADLMNVAAANALLKILEEPPSRGLLILLTDVKHQLMPTIRSRCVNLNIHLTQDEKQGLLPWLQQQSEDRISDGLQDAVLLTDHRPLAALKLWQERGLVQLNQLMDLIHMACTGRSSVPQSAGALTEIEDHQIWQLFQVQTLLLAKSLTDSTVRSAVASHPLNQLIKNSPKVFHIVVKISELVERLMLNFNTQVKTRLMIESVLMTMKQELGPITRR